MAIFDPFNSNAEQQSNDSMPACIYSAAACQLQGGVILPSGGMAEGSDERRQISYYLDPVKLTGGCQFPQTAEFRPSSGAHRWYRGGVRKQKRSSDQVLCVIRERNCGVVDVCDATQFDRSSEQNWVL